MSTEVNGHLSTEIRGIIGGVNLHGKIYIGSTKSEQAVSNAYQITTPGGKDPPTPR